MDDEEVYGAHTISDEALDEDVLEEEEEESY